MIERLANVIFWLGVLLAVLCVAVGLWISVSVTPGADRLIYGLVVLEEHAFILSGIPAAVFFGIGWAARYVLTGRI